MWCCGYDWIIHCCHQAATVICCWGVGSTLTKECGTTTCRECPKTSIKNVFWMVGSSYHALLVQFHWPNLGNRHVRLKLCTLFTVFMLLCFPSDVVIDIRLVDIMHLHSLPLLHCSYMLMPLLFRAALIPVQYFCVESFTMQGPVCLYGTHLKTLLLHQFYDCSYKL